MTRKTKEITSEADALEEFKIRWNKKNKNTFSGTEGILNPGVVSTDIVAIDEMLGGGIPRGRTSVLFGEYSSGKTFFAQLIIAAAQRAGGVAMFFDIERTFDPDWFALTGVDLSDEKFIVVRPRSLEQAFDMIVDALKTVKPAVIVVDSVPAMVPDDMLTAKMEEKDFRGLSARKITEGIAKCTQYNDATALIFINQLRVSMGVSFGNPESMPGGKGLGFYSSLLVRVRRGAWITDAKSSEDEKEANRVGFHLKLRTEKNKLAPPWRSSEFEFKFDGTIEPTGALIRLAIEKGIIVVTGPGYYIVPTVEGKVHGLDTLKGMIKDDILLEKTITDAVRSSVGEEPF